MFFSDITDKFSLHGAAAWRIASETPHSMREFTVNNNLVDMNENCAYWKPVVAAWNTIFPVKTPIASASKIKISLGLSAKSLRILAQSVMTVSNVPIILADKVNEKQEYYEYLRNHLPDICHRGNNISSYLCDIANRVELSLKELHGEVNHVDLDEIVMSNVFRSSSRTLREVRKLKTEKITILGKHLAGQMNAPVPDKAAKIKAFCIQNTWRINDLWGDVKEALLISQRAFIARLGEFKRTLKNLLRVVNNQFGGWSMKFKMYFLINGLLNFIKHYSDDHSCCAQFFWWTQCGDSHTKYVPTQDYCTVLSSGRGPGCRDLIPRFFNLFVASFVMSRYAESQFWKWLCFSRTTICESYFHWKSIIIPKWQNIPAQEYERKERAAFIAFVKQLLLPTEEVSEEQICEYSHRCICAEK